MNGELGGALRKELPLLSYGRRALASLVRNSSAKATYVDAEVKLQTRNLGATPSTLQSACASASFTVTRYFLVGTLCTTRAEYGTKGFCNVM